MSDEQVASTPVQEQPKNDKEYNFRAQEAKYERMLAQERSAREEAERRAQEALQARNQKQEEDEDDDQPYVDHKRLNRTLSSFEKKMEEKIDKKAEEKARKLYEDNRKNDWLKNNPDFYDVLQNAERFANENPDLAEAILEMPEGFERQKLVYKNIKAVGAHKAKSQEPSIQQKVDANRRSPYYQPTGIGTAPYSQVGDFSASGQKNAYAKMKELQGKLRI